MFRQAKQIFRKLGRQKYEESLFSASSLLNCDRHIEKRLLNWRAQKCTAWFRTEVHRSFTQKALNLCFLCETLRGQATSKPRLNELSRYTPEVFPENNTFAEPRT